MQAKGAAKRENHEDAADPTKHDSEAIEHSI